MVCDNSKEQGRCLSHGSVSTSEIIRIPLRYQIVLRLTLNGSQLAGKETSLEGAEVEGTPYTGNSSVIVWTFLRWDGTFIVVWPEKPKW